MSAAGRRSGAALFVGGWLALVAMLVVQTATPGQLGDPAAVYRLALYPLLALVGPAAWFAARQAGRAPRPTPWAGFTLLALPFLIDTVGNIAGLYASIAWWDDLNHLTSWAWLGAGLWLLLGPAVRPRGAALAMVAGLGAALAVGWEVFERLAFYGADAAASVYGDTLADQALGTTGGFLGALVALLVTAGRDTAAPAGRMRA